MRPHSLWHHFGKRWILMRCGPIQNLFNERHNVTFQKSLSTHKLKFKPLFQFDLQEKKEKNLFANSNREHYFFKGVAQVEKGPRIFFFLLKKLWVECLIWTLFFKDDNTFSSTLCEEITHLSLVFSICNACKYIF